MPKIQIPNKKKKIFFYRFELIASCILQYAVDRNDAYSQSPVTNRVNRKYFGNYRVWISNGFFFQENFPHKKKIVSPSVSRRDFFSFLPNNCINTRSNFNNYLYTRNVCLNFRVSFADPKNCARSRIQEFYYTRYRINK